MLCYFDRTTNRVEELYIYDHLTNMDDAFESIGKVICINDYDTNDLAVNKLYYIVSETAELYNIVTDNGKQRKVWKRRFITLDDSFKISGKITQLMTFNMPTIGTYLTQDKIYVCYYDSDYDSMLRTVNNLGKIMFWGKDQFTNFVLPVVDDSNNDYYDEYHDDDDYYDDDNYRDDNDDDDEDYGNSSNYKNSYVTYHKTTTLETPKPNVDTYDDYDFPMFSVRCVDSTDRKYLTVDKIYTVFGISENDYRIKDDRGIDILTYQWRFVPTMTEKAPPTYNMKDILSGISTDDIPDLVSKLLEMYANKK